MAAILVHFRELAPEVLGPEATQLPAASQFAGVGLGIASDDDDDAVEEKDLNAIGLHRQPMPPPQKELRGEMPRSPTAASGISYSGATSGNLLLPSLAPWTEATTTAPVVVARLGSMNGGAGPRISGSLPSVHAFLGRGVTFSANLGQADSFGELARPVKASPPVAAATAALSAFFAAGTAPVKSGDVTCDGDTAVLVRSSGLPSSPQPRRAAPTPLFAATSCTPKIRGGGADFGAASLSSTAVAAAAAASASAVDAPVPRRGGHRLRKASDVRQSTTVSFASSAPFVLPPMPETPPGLAFTVVVVDIGGAADEAALRLAAKNVPGFPLAPDALRVYTAACVSELLKRSPSALGRGAISAPPPLVLCSAVGASAASNGSLVSTSAPSIVLTGKRRRRVAQLAATVHEAQSAIIQQETAQVHLPPPPSHVVVPVAEVRVSLAALQASAHCTGAAESMGIFAASRPLSLTVRLARRRTHRYLCALLSGAQLVSVDWLLACAREGFLQREAPYRCQGDKRSAGDIELLASMLCGAGNTAARAHLARLLEVEEQRVVAEVSAAAAAALPELCLRGRQSARAKVVGKCDSSTAGYRIRSRSHAGDKDNVMPTASGATIEFAALRDMAAALCAPARSSAAALARLAVVCDVGSSSSNSGGQQPPSMSSPDAAVLSGAAVLAGTVAVPLFAGLTLVCWGEFENPPKNTTYAEVVELAALGGAAEVVTELECLEAVASSASCIDTSINEIGGMTERSAGETEADAVWRAIVRRARARSRSRPVGSLPPVIVLCDEPLAKLPPCLAPLLAAREAALATPEWLADCVASMTLFDPSASPWAHRASYAR